MRPHEFLQLVRRTDPELEPELEQVFKPQGTGPVATHPEFIFIVCNILRGFTPREVSEMMEREKKTFVSIDSIREYSLQYIPPYLCLNSLKFRWLEKMGSMDEIGILENLCKVQMMRVMERLDQPSVDPEDDESKRRDIDALRKLTMDTLKAKLETGRYARPAVKHEHSHHVDATVSHEVEEQLPSGLDAREAAEALKALEKIKRLTEGTGDNGDSVH